MSPAKPRDRSFEEEVFIQLWHKLQRHFDVKIRGFRDVHVFGGTGNVWDTETTARFFQVLIAYPFDPAELKRDNKKLCAHIADEVYDDVLKQLAPHNVKPDARHRLFFLATPELKPAWLEEHLIGELKGAYQLSIRLTLAAPDHIPHGPEGPKLIVPGSVDTDFHQAQEDAARETERLLKLQKEQLENLTKIEIISDTAVDTSDAPAVESGGTKEGEPVE